MKNTINLICAILVLFCFVSLFIPVIAPRYPAGEYYAQVGNNDYFFTGDYYLARSFWSITDYVFSAQSLVWKIILSLDQGLLLLWSLMIVQNGSGKAGLGIAILNLAVTSTLVFKMTSSMWACRWAVLVMMALDLIASVAMAVVLRDSGKTAKNM